MNNTTLMYNYLNGVIYCYVDVGDSPTYYYIDNQNFTNYTQKRCDNNLIITKEYELSDDIVDGKVEFKKYSISNPPLGLSSTVIGKIMSVFTSCWNTIHTEIDTEINFNDISKRIDKSLQTFETAIYTLANISDNNISSDEAIEIISTGKRYLLLTNVTQYVYNNYIYSLTDNYGSTMLLEYFNSASLDTIIKSNTLQKIIEGVSTYNEKRIDVGDFVYVKDSIIRYGTVYRTEPVSDGTTVHNICTVYLDNGTLKDYNEESLTKISITQSEAISTSNYSTASEQLQTNIKDLRYIKSKKVIDTSYVWTKDGDYSESVIGENGEPTGELIPWYTIEARDNNGNVYTSEYYKPESLEPMTSSAELEVDEISVTYGTSSTSSTISNLIQIYFPTAIENVDKLTWIITNSSGSTTYNSEENPDRIVYNLNQDKTILNIYLKLPLVPAVGYSEIANFIVDYSYNPSTGYAIDSESVTLDSSGTVKFKVKPTNLINIEEVNIDKTRTIATDSVGNVITNPSINVAYYDTIPLGDSTGNYYRYRVYKKINNKPVLSALSLFDFEDIIECTMSKDYTIATDVDGVEIPADTRYIYYDNVTNGEADQFEYLYTNSVLRRLDNIMGTTDNNIWLTGSTLIEGNTSRARLDTLYMIDTSVAISVPNILTKYKWNYSNLNSFIYENTNGNNYVRYGLTFGPSASVEEGDSSYAAYIKMATHENGQELSLNYEQRKTLRHVYITKDRRYAIMLNGRVCRDPNDTSETDIAEAVNYPLYSNTYYYDAISISDNENVARIWTKKTRESAYGYHYFGTLNSDNKIPDKFFKFALYQGDYTDASGWGSLTYDKSTGNYTWKAGSLFTGKKAKPEDNAWFFKLDGQTKFVYYDQVYTDGDYTTDIFKCSKITLPDGSIKTLTTPLKYIWDWNAPFSYERSETADTSLPKYIMAVHRTDKNIAALYPTVARYGNFVQIQGVKKCIGVKEDDTITDICWSALDIKGNLIEHPDTTYIYKHFEDEIACSTNVFFYNPICKTNGRIECYFQAWNGSTENYTFIEESSGSTNIVFALDKSNVIVPALTVYNAPGNYSGVPVYLPQNYIDPNGDGSYSEYTKMYGDDNSNCIYTYNETSNSFIKTDLDVVTNVDIDTSYFKNYRIEESPDTLHPVDGEVLTGKLFHYSSNTSFNYYYEYNSSDGIFYRLPSIPESIEVEVVDVIPEFLKLTSSETLSSDGVYLNSQYTDCTYKYYVYDDVDSIYTEYTRYKETDEGETNILVRNANLDTDSFLRAYDANTGDLITPDTSTIYSLESETAATVYYYKYINDRYVRDDTLTPTTHVKVIPDGILTIRDEYGEVFSPVAMNNSKQNIVYLDSISDGGTGQYFKYYDDKYQKINASEVSQSELSMNVTLTLVLRDLNI